MYKDDSDSDSEGSGDSDSDSDDFEPHLVPEKASVRKKRSRLVQMAIKRSKQFFPIWNYGIVRDLEMNQQKDTLRRYRSYHNFRAKELKPAVDKLSAKEAEPDNDDWLDCDSSVRSISVTDQLGLRSKTGCVQLMEKRLETERKKEALHEFNMGRLRGCTIVAEETLKEDIQKAQAEIEESVRTQEK